MKRLLLLLSLSASTLAPAAPRWGLSWRAPGACIGPAELSQAVEDRLGHSVFGSNPDFRIDGVAKEYDSPPRWRAKVTVVDSSGSISGSRDVTSDDANCRSLDARLALVVSLMVDPN